MPISQSLIIQSIKKNKCVILLGPYVAKNKRSEPMQLSLLKYLKQQGLNIDNDLVNLFKCDSQTKFKAEMFLEDFYKNFAEPSELHRQLALIPVRLIISITPDVLLKQVFDEYNIDYDFNYYIMGKNPNVSNFCLLKTLEIYQPKFIKQQQLNRQSYRKSILLTALPILPGHHTKPVA